MFDRKSKRLVMMLIVFVLAVVMTACGKGETGGTGGTDGTGNNEPPASQTPPEPITLQVQAGDGSFTQEEFDKYFVPSIEKKFPHITLEYISTSPEQLVTQGTYPDIGMGGVAMMNRLLNLDVPMDLNELVKKEDADLSKYVDGGIKVIKDYSENDELLGLPMWINNYVTLYNKDIFDKFGADYPVDEMTWEEMIEVAKDVTRMDDGVQYKGLAFANLHQLGEQLGLTLANGDKGVLNTDGWQTVFRIAKDIYSIPGNEPANPASLGSGADNAFFSEQNLAMLVSFGSRVARAATDTQNNVLTFDWDIVSHPTFSQAPGLSPRFDAQVYYVSKTSKHPEEAFQVIYHMTTDLETQSSIARSAKARPALDIDIDTLDEIFGADFPSLKDKNTQGLFKSFPNTEFKSTPYDSVARKILREEFAHYFLEEVDLNTALRVAEEKLNAEIKAMNEQ